MFYVWSRWWAWIIHFPASREFWNTVFSPSFFRWLWLRFIVVAGQLIVFSILLIQNWSLFPFINVCGWITHHHDIWVVLLMNIYYSWVLCLRCEHHHSLACGQDAVLFAWSLSMLPLFVYLFRCERREFFLSILSVVLIDFSRVFL